MMCFSGGINDVTGNQASQFSTGYFKFIRGGKIEAEFDAQAFGEVGETTGENGGSVSLHSARKQLASPGEREQSFTIDTR